MKANEAPEKIYIHVRANKELGTTWHGKKITNGDIEYTRTDAFIEKAANYLNNFYNEDTHSCLIDEDIDKFINYMKGE